MLGFGRATCSTLLHIALIVLLIFVAYSGSFDGAFVSDDIRRVRDNPSIRSLQWSHIKEIFTTFDGANYMPLKVLSLAVDYQLWGPTPTGFHITNLLIHISCAFVIYIILMRMGMRPPPAFLTALLWALHPLQVESVAWISERKNVLSGLFFFAAFYFYLGFSENRRIRTYLAVLGLYSLALLTKMNTMVLPALFLAYEATYRFRLRIRDLLVSLPFLLLAAVVAWYNLAGNPIHGTTWHGGSVVVTWLSTSVVFIRYLRNLIMPIDLHLWYEVPLYDSLKDPVVLFSLSIIGTITAATIWLVYTRRQWGFWVLWFGITLAPMLNIIVPFRSLMQDRYMYLALLGPLALVVNYLVTAMNSPAVRRGLMTLVGAVILMYISLTYRQVEVWSNPLTLWTSGAVRFAFPTDEIVRIPNDHNARVTYLRDALAVNPSSGILHNNLAVLHFNAGHIDDALPGMETAAKLEPENAVILLNLGRAYARSGRPRAAEQLLSRAVVLAPYSSVIRLNLARVYLSLGNTKAARYELDAYARLRPASSRIFHKERVYLERLEAAQRRQK